jgi:hypothetical protein
MKMSCALLLLLAACAGAAEAPVYAPIAVDMPVPMSCKMPDIKIPDDALAALPRDATLTQFTKTCAEQTLLDKAALSEMAAALKACAE